MIRTFGDSKTAAIYQGECPKGFSVELAKAGRRKLAMIMAASSVASLAYPPGNQLKTVKSVPGMHSIRVNQQFRIVFRWVDGAAEDVRLTDYKH